MQIVVSFTEMEMTNILRKLVLNTPTEFATSRNKICQSLFSAATLRSLDKSPLVDIDEFHQSADYDCIFDPEKRRIAILMGAESERVQELEIAHSVRSSICQTGSTVFSIIIANTATSSNLELEAKVEGPC